MSVSLFALNSPSFWLTCETGTISWTSSIPEGTQENILFELHWIPSLPPSPAASLPSSTPSTAPPPLSPDARRSIGRRAPPNSEGSVVVRGFTAPTTARSYDWDAVNVPEGMYYLDASFEYGSILVHETSDAFPVYNATDLSCLIALPVPSSSAGIPPATTSPQTGSPISTQSSTLGPVPSNQLPVGGSGKNVNVGAIAGGVVGGVAGAIMIIFAVFFFLRRRRHAKGTSAPSIKSSKSGGRGPGRSGPQMGKWKGLGSVDLHDPEMANVSASSRGTLQKEEGSAGSNESSGPPSLPYVITPATTDLGHDEKKASLTSPKKPSRKPVPSYLDVIPPTTPFSSTTNLESPRTMSASPNIPPTSVSSSPASDFLPYESRRSSTRQLRHTYNDHPMDEEEAQAELMVQNLQRSASQGDLMQMKPVHYLIPDLPLDQQYHARRS